MKTGGCEGAQAQGSTGHDGLETVGVQRTRLWRKTARFAAPTERKLSAEAEQRGGKAAGELSARVNAVNAGEMVLRDDIIGALQGTSQGVWRSGVTVGHEA